jgi:hypothetical protein
MTMTGEIESEGTGVGLDEILLDDPVIDSAGLAPRKVKGSSAKQSMVELLFGWHSFK